MFFGLIVGAGVAFVTPAKAQDSICLVRPVRGLQHITQIRAFFPRIGSYYRVTLPERVFRASIASFSVASSSGTARVIRNRNGTLTINGRFPETSEEEVVRISGIEGVHLVGLPEEKLDINRVPKGTVGDADILRILFKLGNRTECGDPQQPDIHDYDANQIIDERDFEKLIVEHFGRPVAVSRTIGDIVITLRRR